MARRSGFLQTMVRAQREAERRRTAQLRGMAKAQTQAASAAEKARKDYERAAGADQKERARLYTESRMAQIDFQNEQLEEQVNLVERVLLDALSIDTFINLQTLKQTPNLPAFNPGLLGIAETQPQTHMYTPTAPTGIQKFLPGAKEKYAQEGAKAQEVYRTHVAEHASREMVRQRALAEIKMQYDRQVAEERERITLQHTEIDTFQQDLLAGSPQAIVDYFTMVLASSSYPDEFQQQHAKIAYVPESAHPQNK